MLIDTKKGYYQSSLLAGFPWITHGYSTRFLGDMRIKSKQMSYLNILGLPGGSVVMGQQVHGTRVVVVKDTKQDEYSLADGMILTSSSPRELAAGVVIADCAPLLMADGRGKCVGVVHAGWKGTLGNIAKNAVDKMIDCGAKLDELVVSIGPRIGMCCYSVPEERAAKFAEVYGQDPKIATKTDGSWYLDIGYVNWLQLRRLGISADHIDVQPTCTSCQIKTFYSYRKDTKNSFGETLAVIGFTNDHGRH